MTSGKRRSIRRRGILTSCLAVCLTISILSYGILTFHLHHNTGDADLGKMHDAYDISTQTQSSNFSIHLFSAYYDDRPTGRRPTIRILALTSLPVVPTLSCNALSGPSSAHRVGFVTQVKVELLSVGRLVNQYIFLCDAGESEGEGDLGPAIDSVQLCGTSKCESPTSNTVAVTRPPSRGDAMTLDSSLCVCTSVVDNSDVTPNPHPVTSAVSHQFFLEFVEMCRILGVDNIILYHKHIKHKHEKLKATTLSLLRFRPLPPSFEKMSLERLSYFLMNDCLFTAMNRYRYVVFLDLDDILVPNSSVQLLSTMLQSLEVMHNTTLVGAYIFQTYRFFDESSNSTASYHYGLPGSQKVSRLPRVVTHRLRSPRCLEERDHARFVVEPRKIDHVTGSGVLKMLPGYFHISVPSQYGIVRHFVNEKVSKKGLNDLVLDATADKLVPKLFRALHRIRYF